MLSNLMAILLQALAARLGIVSGRDLRRPAAIITRAHDASSVAALRVAIAACDLAEVIGSAIALNLLFGLPLIWGSASPRSTCCSSCSCSSTASATSRRWWSC
jgi:manganese transport protein